VTPAPPPVPTGPGHRPRRTAADVRREKLRKRRRRQRRFGVTLGLLALLAATAFATLAFAARSDGEKIADGVTVAGYDVGGMTEKEALALLQREIADPANEPVVVKVAGKKRKLTAEDADVMVDLQGAVDQAVDASQDGSFLERGWRKIRGASVDKEIAATVSANKRAVRKFVSGISKDVARSPVNAELSLAVTDVAVTPGKNGRKLDGARALERRIYRALTTRDAPDRLKAKVASVPPKVTEKDIYKQNPVIVTVSRDSNTARVFKEGKLTTTYKVAVGEPKYPTPVGKFTVQSKQVDPAWNVPDSDWAGDLAGTTVPGGAANNPLKERWIGFNGSVGFHGTGDVGSLGRGASHGCVRMAPSDVIDLYERVEVGTTVLVA
jgi:lipoprotein-anchoring transpeptidase ErfK/SrfK